MPKYIAEAFSDKVRCAISGDRPTMRLACAGGNDPALCSKSTKLHLRLS